MIDIKSLNPGDEILLKNLDELEYEIGGDMKQYFGKWNKVDRVYGDTVICNNIAFYIYDIKDIRILRTELDMDSVRERLYRNKCKKITKMPCEGGSCGVSGVKDDGFMTKDSGKREEFSTGSLRDTQEGKPRYDLLSTHGLKRLAMLMARGAEKYGERNRELGQETDRFLASMMRHMFQYAEGDTSEDHLAAVCFNAMGIMHMQEEGRNDMLKNKADNIFIK